MSLGEYIGAGASITKGLWHLNGNINDSSGNNTVTYFGGSPTPSYNNGKFGQGVVFNGSSNFLYIADTNFGGTGSFTMSVWAKLISTSGLQTLISQYGITTGYAKFFFGFQSGGNLCFYLYNTSGTGYLTIDTSLSLSTGVMRNYIATYNDSSKSSVLS